MSSPSFTMAVRKHLTVLPHTDDQLDDRRGGERTVTGKKALGNLLNLRSRAIPSRYFASPAGHCARLNRATILAHHPTRHYKRGWHESFE